MSFWLIPGLWAFQVYFSDKTVLRLQTKQVIYKFHVTNFPKIWSDSVKYYFLCYILFVIKMFNYIVFGFIVNLRFHFFVYCISAQLHHPKWRIKYFLGLFLHQILEDLRLMTWLKMNNIFWFCGQTWRCLLSYAHHVKKNWCILIHLDPKKGVHPFEIVCVEQPVNIPS